MKKRTVLTTFLLPLLSVPALGWLSMTEYERATEYGAKLRTTYVIVDDCGNPVPDVKVHIWLGLENHKDGGRAYYDYTDSDGRYVLDGKTTGLVRYSFVRDGYYETQKDMHLDDVDDQQKAVKNGKWQPYGQTQKVILKRIINPSVTKWHYGELIRPPNNCWVGLDLETLKFCSPHGSGSHADILLRQMSNLQEEGWRNLRGTLEISFTNQPYAGAYVLKKDEWSDFKSHYAADTNNTYRVRSFKYERAREPEKIIKYEGFPKDSYIVFRTRTKIDSNGNLLSAHYGKIYGPWGYGDAVRFESVLFNPNPNDPNLEEEDTATRARLHIKGMRERGELK